MADITDFIEALRDQAAGLKDAASTVGTGIVLSPFKGLYGLGKLATTGDFGEAAKAIEGTHGTGETPKTEEGRQYLTDLGQGMTQAGELARPLTEPYEAWATKHPALAAGGEAALGMLPIGRAREAAVQGVKSAVEAARPLARDVALAAALRQDAPVLSGVTRRAQAPAARAAREPTVPRSAEGLAPVKAAGEEDIVRSLMNAHAGKKTIPREDIDTALANRAELRAESPSLPKPAAEMTDEDWADWGASHGVDMSRTPSQSLGISDLTTRKEVMVPGGLEGKFTIPDLFELKANNFDPNALPQDVHNALMKKFMRTYERPEGMDAVDKYNALNFALLSPNAPLTQNEFLAQRFRVRTPEELADIAGSTPEALRANELGTGAAARGGMGVKGTADLGNMGKLARVLREAPQVFSAGVGETLKDVARRVMNQVPGLGPKTASLGVPWLDLGKANTSAVDLHMIRNNFAKLMGDPELGPQFTDRLASLTGQKNADADSLLAMSKADPKFASKLEDAAIDVIGGDAVGMKYRLASGELNPKLHPALAPEKLGHEPEQAIEFNPYYNRVVDYVDASRGANPELPLFPEQWRLWDRYRGRVEPHEMAHPDFRKLPKMSWEEMKDSLDAHKLAGYMRQGVQPQEPVPWGRLYYGSASNPMLAATAAGGAGAYALMRALRDDGSDPKSR